MSEKPSADILARANKIMADTDWRLRDKPLDIGDTLPTVRAILEWLDVYTADQAGKVDLSALLCQHGLPVERGCDKCVALLPKRLGETLCLGRNKPFSSPDHDPRCSSCVESGTGPEPWTCTFYLARQDKPSDPDHTLTCIFCSKSSGVEWEFGYRPEGTGKLVGAGICDWCRLKLKPFVPRAFAQESESTPREARVIKRGSKRPDSQCECDLTDGGPCGAMNAGVFMLEGWPDSMLFCERCEVTGHNHDRPKQGDKNGSEKRSDCDVRDGQGREESGLHGAAQQGTVHEVPGDESTRQARADCAEPQDEASQEVAPKPDPNCKWLKWVESKRAAPVVEPVGEPMPIADAVEVLRTHFECAGFEEHHAVAFTAIELAIELAIKERDTALAEVEQAKLSAKEWCRLCFASRAERDGLLNKLNAAHREVARANSQRVMLEINLGEQLSISNTEAVRLRSELETAQQRLAEGVEVMNARQVADREEIARLKGELAHWLLVKDEPAVLGRLCVIKLARKPAPLKEIRVSDPPTPATVATDPPAPPSSETAGGGA